MKKTLLTERFQQLAGIKPLYELEDEPGGEDPQLDYLSKSSTVNPEHTQALLSFLQKNKGEVEKAVGEPLIDFFIDDLGDVGSTTTNGFTGYAFRHAKDVDSEFLGVEGEPSKPITVAGAWLNYIEYNI